MVFESYLPPKAVEEMIAKVEEKGSIDLMLGPDEFSAIMHSLDQAWRLSILPVNVLEDVGKLITALAGLIGVDIEEMREAEAKEE